MAGTAAFHPHALERMAERGAGEDEATATATDGERFAVKFGRTGFRRDFPFDAIWRGRHYLTKQIEVIAVEEDGGLAGDQPHRQIFLTAIKSETETCC